MVRWVDWAEPLRFALFKKIMRVKIEVGEGEREVRICADAPVNRGLLALGIGKVGEDAVWEDNFVDVVLGRW